MSIRRTLDAHSHLGDTGGKETTMGMTVKLAPDAETFANELVASGRFRTPDEVVQEAMTVLRRTEARARLDAMIAAGQADLDAGRVYSADEVFARLEVRYASAEIADK